ncbi:hypothetical protein [Leptothoe spongobia]|uniref:hypothetical protein n=1 Tax=Leptothoe spongobia TaxID=2651728 RepID=UPI001FEA8A22|nr:hypothetical protein [Leptothoe spongobia]
MAYTPVALAGVVVVRLMTSAIATTTIQRQRWNIELRSMMFQEAAAKRHEATHNHYYK